MDHDIDQSASCHDRCHDHSVYCMLIPDSYKYKLHVMHCKKQTLALFFYLGAIKSLGSFIYKWWYKLIYTGLPRSMPNAINANQCWSKFWHWSQCRSIPINADQCRSMIGIERHFGSMPWFWSALIGIGHWSDESCIQDWSWHHSWNEADCFKSLILYMQFRTV